MAFNVNDQVVVKKKLNNCTRIQIGSIVGTSGKDAFVVHIQGEPRSKVVSVNDMQSVGDVYPGRKFVDHVAARRGNFKPYRP